MQYLILLLACVALASTQETTSGEMPPTTHGATHPPSTTVAAGCVGAAWNTTRDCLDANKFSDCNATNIAEFCSEFSTALTCVDDQSDACKKEFHKSRGDHEFGNGCTLKVAIAKTSDACEKLKEAFDALDVVSAAGAVRLSLLVAFVVALAHQL